jgi:N-acetylglucosamine-6-phosphate deacetylase
MPQLHHRDPAIIGLLGASPHLSSPNPISFHLPCNLAEPLPLDLSASFESATEEKLSRAVSEAFDQGRTPPRQTIAAFPAGKISRSISAKSSRPALHLEKGQIADMPFERPYYGIIVDGIHCHPNSVRVRTGLK